MGDSAVTVELGPGVDLGTSARVRALAGAVDGNPFRGFVESVPTHGSLLVLYERNEVAFSDVRAFLLDRLTASREPAAPGALHRLPTVYGGEEGPDLGDLSRDLSLSESEIVARHAGREYTCLMLGFAPGFAYLGPLHPSLAAPRRATPRLRVPRGAVGIAGGLTGVYPTTAAGGWNLVGRTAVTLFDPEAEPPALILPGDRVAFEPVSTLTPEARRAPPRLPEGRPALEVRAGGLLTTVQDRGRRGYRRLGVTGAGPMDAEAHTEASRLVGNPADAAALECTAGGLVLQFLESARFALAGADFDAVLILAGGGEQKVPPRARVSARRGDLLRLGERRAGFRAVLAFSGGIDVPRVLGSRSTDLGAGFGGLGGRRLRAGDRLALGDARPEAPAPRPGATRTLASEVTVRVVPGPQSEHFTDAAHETLAGHAFVLGTASDRVGFRLAGPRLDCRSGGTASDGMVPGCIQVPPDGQPILMMADAPTTGGYPKIATVVTADLPLLAQLVPGEGRVRFRPVSVESRDPLSPGPGLG